MGSPHFVLDHFELLRGIFKPKQINEDLLYDDLVGLFASVILVIGAESIIAWPTDAHRFFTPVLLNSVHVRLSISKCQ